MPEIYDAIAASERGRLVDGKYIQKLEVLGKDYTNTITTVTKDNLIIEVYNGETWKCDLYK